MTPTPTPSTGFAPSLSPDGRWLACVSGLSGTPEIYVRPFGRPGARTQVSTDGGVSPVRSRSGREILHVDVANALRSAP